MSGEFRDAELETLPWSALERWQGERLAGFVSGLSRRSRFYAARLAGLPAAALAPTSLAALAELPFTDKDAIRAAQADPPPGEPFGGLQAAPLADIVQVLSSSGTTGQPTYYALTARDLANWRAAIAQAFFTAGVRRGDVVAHLVGLPMVAGGLSYADGFRELGATLAWLGGFPPERILAAIPRLQASALLATTSFGVHLADHCHAIAGVEARALGIRKFLSGGEPGLAQPEIRRRIVQGFGTAHVRETMGLGDVLSMMWAECDAGDGMHFNAQRLVAVELVDPASGAPLAWRDGALGEAVYTTFDRDATPLLRYRSRDHLRVVATTCRCGRTSPRVQCVGRTDDMLIYKGMNVFPSAIRDVVLARAGALGTPYLRVLKARADQVRFDEPIPVELEAAEPLPATQCEAIARDAEAAVRAQLQVRISLAVLPPGSLPRSQYKTPITQVRDESVAHAPPPGQARGARTDTA